MRPSCRRVTHACRMQVREREGKAYVERAFNGNGSGAGACLARCYSGNLLSFEQVCVRCFAGLLSEPSKCSRS